MNAQDKCLWGGDEWKQILIYASHQRVRAHLIETDAWITFDPSVRPVTTEQWQLTLFWAAASGTPDIVGVALKNGANPTGPLVCSWIGVLHGRLLPCHSRSAAYHWVKSLRRKPDDGLFIHTPLQAATAGACSECMCKIIDAGARLEPLLTWFIHTPHSLPRVAAGLAIGEVMVNRKEVAQHEICFSVWLESAQQWLLWKAGKDKVDRTEREALTNLYRRMERVCNAYRVEFRITSEMLAELL